MQKEALAAKEACANLLLEEDRQIHALFRGQEGALLGDHGALGGDLHGYDLPRKTGGKGHHTAAAPGSVAVLEEVFAGEHPAEYLAEAAGGGLHFHIGAHPYHRAALGNHGFSVFHVADHHRGGFAFDFILHQDPAFQLDWMERVYQFSSCASTERVRGCSFPPNVV